MRLSPLWNTSLVGALMAMLLAFPATAATPTVDKAVATKILKKLKQARADLPYGAVEVSPIDGVYQVQVTQGPTLFVSADGEHFIAGDLFAIKANKFVNLQEQAREAQRGELMASVAKKDMIIYSPKGETKAVINVFTDVDCGYCRKLHQEMPALHAKGIEVRYLAFPRAGVNSASYDKIATAWCADDPQQALTRLKNREPMAIKVCDNNPVAAQFDLGNKMGVRGTPALVLANGELIAGYRSADELAKDLGL